MLCRQCGAEITTEAVFCHLCGARLAEEDEHGEELPKEKFQQVVHDKQQGDDEAEQEIWQGNYSKLAMFSAWIAAAVATFLLLLGGAIWARSGTAWTVIFAIILVMWVGLYVRLLYRQLSVHYFLTNQRFIHERGLLWRVIDRIEVIDIDDVTCQQGPIERLLGVGTICITSSDRTHPEITLPGIGNVTEVAAQIDDLRRAERRKRGLHIEAV